VLQHRRDEGRAFSIIVVAEDAHPHPDEPFLDQETSEQIYRHEQLGGIGNVLAHEIERCTTIEARVTKLGYVQRGGSPSPFDRILATRFGIKAFDMTRDKEWGHMTALRGSKIVSIPLEEAVREIKRLDEEIYRVAEIFFG
jgi:6-phosphofructokinase 1